MNTTQHAGEWSILKNAAAMFSRRQRVSSLHVTWAGVLRSDSAGLVPEANEEVRFRVANEMFLCEEGKPLVFDDSWNPEAWDQTNGYRVVFLSDSARATKEPMGRRLQHFFTRLVRS